MPETHNEYWSERIARNVDRDRDTDRRLREAGWLPLRVWEHDDPEDAADRIEEAVVARRQT